MHLRLQISKPKQARCFLPLFICLIILPNLFWIVDAHAKSRIDVVETKKTQLKNLIAFAEVTIKGKVSDENGEALPGVTVSVEGSVAGTVTDLDGNYSITVQEGSTLVFSFIGYATQRIAIGDQSTLDVVLTPDIQALSEVV